MGGDDILFHHSAILDFQMENLQIMIFNNLQV